MISISVIVPAYNEEESIVSAVKKDIEILDAYKCNYELIIVNDGSSDNTLALLHANFKNNISVRILSNPQNQGFGGAVRTGIELATKDAIIVVPVDSPLEQVMFEAFIQHYDKADVLVSYRTERKGYNAMMKLNSWLYHQLVQCMFGINLVDYNWIHLYKTKPFRQAGIEIESRGIFMLAEVLIKCKAANLSMVEFPVTYYTRTAGIASASKLKVILKTLAELSSFRIRFHS
jgi:glycosyltransferase involved in cell wall biosynthesis